LPLLTDWLSDGFTQVWQVSIELEHEPVNIYGSEAEGSAVRLPEWRQQSLDCEMGRVQPGECWKFMDVTGPDPGPASLERLANDRSVIGGPKKTVMIIDDSPEICMIINETLSLFGFGTIMAGDGATGVKLAATHLPNLIICDINMPEMDGYATLKAMREQEATATIPLVFLSGVSDRITIRKGMELGADDYLTKPFSPKELMAAVNARLEKQAKLQNLSDRRLDELRGNITLALPHELRTPLNGIMGLAHMMMEDYQSMPPEEVLESSRFIYDSACRLHRLIENFLVYSQIELMASEAKCIEVSGAINPIAVQDVVPDLARNVAAHYRREGDLLLKIEPARLLIATENLTKIVEELVDNAFKFSEAGKPVLVATEISNGRFCFQVADKGRGMTAEQISRIGPHIQFERRTFEQQGAGLGLFIAKRLTELLGGQILLESTLGSGTAVKIQFAIPGI
jgi:two-component system, sensor histidine kinase and response regulator